MGKSQHLRRNNTNWLYRIILNKLCSNKMKSLSVCTIIGWMAIAVRMQSSLSFTPTSTQSTKLNRNGYTIWTKSKPLFSAPADSDFEKPISVQNLNANSAVDPNVYNVNAEKAADL